MIELLRLWLPLLLTRIGPAMRPQLQAVISHLVQQSLDRNVVPDALRRLPGLQNAESEFSRQLAESMVTSVLDLSKGAGNRIGQRDPVLESLGSEVLDRLWEELAHTLEQGPVLSRSQDLLVALLEEIKRSSFRQIRDQGDMDALISELDGLNFNPERPTPKDRLEAGEVSGGIHLHERSFDQLSIGSQGLESLVIRKSLDCRSAQSAIALAAGVEQQFPVTEGLVSGHQHHLGRWSQGDVVHLMGDTSLSEPGQCLSTSAAAVVAVDLDSFGQDSAAKQ